VKIEIIDNSPKVLEALQAACLRALEECGLVAEGYAKRLCPVDTGNLRNSISHRVDSSELAVYVGTPSEYGIYVECGTGKYYPGGRQDPWFYEDEKGNGHITHGQRAQPFIKPAVADHAKNYRDILKNKLKNA